MWKFFLAGIEVEEPVGWDAIQFNLQRRPDAGFSFAFTDSLTFQGQGAAILQTAYERQFINAITPISIVLYDSPNCLEIVDQYFGEINFKIYEQTDEGVKVGIMDSGIFDKLNANRSTIVNLRNDKGLNGKDLTPLSNTRFKLHSQTLEGSTEYRLSGDTFFDLYSDPTQACGRTYDALIGLQIGLTQSKNSLQPLGINARQLNSFIGVYTPVISPLVQNVQLTNISFTNSVIEVSGHVSGNLRVVQRNTTNACGVTSDAGLGTTVEVRRIVISNGVTVTDFTLIASQALPSGGAFNDFAMDFTDSYDLPSGFSIAYTVRFNTPSGGPTIVYYYECNMDKDNFVEFTLDKNEPSTECFGLYTYEYLNRIAESITGVNGVLKSDFFQSPITNFSALDFGPGSLSFLANGLAIRNAIDDQNKPFPINDSWQNAFEQLSKIFGLGYQIESENGKSISIRVEHLSYFYNSGQTLKIDNIQTYTRKPWVDKVYSDVRLGYDESNLPEEYNGVFEFNTTRNFNILGSTNRQTLDLVTNYGASGYSIEAQRRLQFFDITRDNKTDNTIFIVCLNNEVVEIETEEQVELDVWQADKLAEPGYRYEIGTCSEVAVVVATGQVWFNINGNLPFGNVAYNLRVSPGRVARWNWCQIAGSLLGTGNNFVQFTTGTYNLGLETIANVGKVPEPFRSVVIENSDVRESDVDQSIRQPIYLPETFEFQYPQRLCEFIKLRLAPGQLIVVSQEGLTFAGVLQSANNTPGSDGLTSFTILRK